MNARSRYFISYRRSPARETGTEEARILRHALRDRGIITWRDLDDLGAEPTETQLTDVLQHPDTAGAILIVSPEVESSPVIRNVEARRIFQRYERDPDFLVKVVLVGLNYADANRVLGAPAGFQDLSDWNLHRIQNESLSEEDARTIARDAVRHRLRHLTHDANDDVLQVGFFSRRGAGPGPFALRHDVSPYFDGRRSPEGTYARIQSALTDSAGSILSAVDSPRIVGRGNVSLPLGALFGAVYSPLADFRLSWRQGLAGHPETLWTHGVAAAAIEVAVSVKTHDAASEDIVLALGVSANIESAVTSYLNAHRISRRVAIHVAPKDGSVAQGVALTAAEGVTIVNQAIQAARHQKDDLRLSRAGLHLFLACPLAMAVLLGQKLNTFSECVLYDHDPGLTPPYRLVHRFDPSSLRYDP